MTVNTITIDSELALFQKEILEGLKANPKRLPSKYFYDEKGDELFQQIMEMPSYYLTNCETEIFQNQKAEILKAIDYKSFKLVELGAGDGTKTKILLEYFMEQNIDIQYCPIDISENVLNILAEHIKQDLPSLDLQLLVGDYFRMLDRLSDTSDQPKVILFLGSNIGNMTSKEAIAFLQEVYAHMSDGDLFMIGFDLKKNPQTILDAYNDDTQITAAFNFNLLSRINKTLNADFDIDQFLHWPTYNPITGETKSYLVSKIEQTVTFGNTNDQIHFEAWEAIDMELSQKYSISEINQKAISCGFTLVDNFMDSNRFYVDAVWKK
ncbi:MAG: L-histidine N(alpha)-methyltransferase [Bacteroidota bacterium]